MIYVDTIPIFSIEFWIFDTNGISGYRMLIQFHVTQNSRDLIQSANNPYPTATIKRATVVVQAVNTFPGEMSGRLSATVEDVFLVRANAQA